MTSPNTLGKYEILGQLGAGGMAEVFLARQLGAAGFEKRVAIKRLMAHRLADPMVVRSLINEARLAAQLTHPNLVQVFDFELIGQEYCMVMEYIEGVTLNELLDRCHRAGVLVPQGLVIYLAMEILTGLDYAHTATAHDGTPHRLVHRDLKPANIMISNRGLVKVMDFGIAKAVTNLFQTTSSGSTKGTLAYMSPEQLSGSPVTATSDLFSFGLMLYELATLEPLFQDLNIVQLSHDMYQGLQPRAQARLEACFPALVPIVRQLLNPSPEARYPDAHSLLKVLRPLTTHAGAHELTQFLSDIASMAQATEPSHATLPAHALMSVSERSARTLVDSAQTGGYETDAITVRRAGTVTALPSGEPEATLPLPDMTARRRALPPLALASDTVPAPPRPAMPTGMSEGVAAEPPAPLSEKNSDIREELPPAASPSAARRSAGAVLLVVGLVAGLVLVGGGQLRSPSTSDQGSRRVEAPVPEAKGSSEGSGKVSAGVDPSLPGKGETAPGAGSPSSPRAVPATPGGDGGAGGPARGDSVEAPALEGSTGMTATPSGGSGTGARRKAPGSAAAPAGRGTGGGVEPSAPAENGRQARTGYLVVNAQPWAEVFVDGVSRGEFFKAELEPGKHRIRLVGPDGQEKRFEVDLEAGASVTRIWSFTAGQWMQ